MPKATKRSTIRANQAEEASTELYLIKRAITSKASTGQEMDLSLPHILYNFNSELQRLGYKAGYAFGELASIHFSGMSTLEGLLVSAGMGKPILYFFDDVAKLTSNKSTSARVGSNIHYFESGIVAGFLSNETNTQLNATEVQCAFNNQAFCQFEVSKALNPFSNINAVESFDNAASFLSIALNNHKPGQQSDEAYYLLSLLPLMQKPLLSSVSKLSYIIGRRLADINTDDSTITKLISYLRLSGRLSRKEITLSYPPLLSLSGYVEISTSLLKGYLSKINDAEITLKRHLSQGAYKVDMIINKQ